jgi:hypothetical protein
VVGGWEGLVQKPWGRRGAPVAVVEVAQRQVSGIESQKEKISNCGKNEKIHLQVNMEIEQVELGRIQKLLQQGKNQFFHVELFGRKRETKVDG